MGSGSTLTLWCCLQASRDTKSTLSRDKVCPQKGQLLHPLDMLPTNSCFLRCGWGAQGLSLGESGLSRGGWKAAVPYWSLPLGLPYFWLWFRMAAFSPSASVGKGLLGWEQDSNKQTCGFLLAWLHLWFLPTVPEWMGDALRTEVASPLPSLWRVSTRWGSSAVLGMEWGSTCGRAVLGDKGKESTTHAQGEGRRGVFSAKTSTLPGPITASLAGAAAGPRWHRLF